MKNKRSNTVTRRKSPRERREELYGRQNPAPSLSFAKKVCITLAIVLSLAACIAITGLSRGGM